MDSASAALPLPPSETIHQVAGEIVSRRYYKLDSHETDPSQFLAWLKEILGTLGPLFKPVGDMFKALEDISPALAWTLFIGLGLVAVLIIVHIIYSFVVAVRGPRLRALREDADTRKFDFPETWEEKAHEAAGAGKFTSAARFLLRACLLRLSQTRDRPYRRGATNREYLRQFHQTRAFEPLRSMVEVIDEGWYAGGTCTEVDYRLCAAAHEKIRRWATTPTDADAT